MTPPADDKPLEPWPGYAKLDPSERRALFDVKVREARQRGDLLYAKALCAAVAATETLAPPAAGTESDDDSLRSWARKTGDKVDDYGEALFKEAGGWTPK